jgi:hypothetical protein
MPTATIKHMRGLEVHLNGDKLCTAGINSDAALNAAVDVIGRETDYEMTVRVGGLADNEFVIWSDRELRVGDEISIKIVETETSDTPERRNPHATSET